MELVKNDRQPFIVAETGAVNNNHSGPFRYYSIDDRGIIFVDSVYTPIFLGSASCGHIWHWNNRYVESKNLYKYYKPLYNLIKDINFDKENFETVDLSDDDVYLFLLEGDTVTLGFVRNKSDNWQDTLIDNNPPVNIDFKELTLGHTKK